MGSIVALAVIVVLGIVYAAFTQQLTINGTATGRSSNWKIYFSRLTGPTLNGTAKQITAPEIKNNSTTIGDYSVTVTSPGDYIEYEFDVTNDGDYDATLTNLSMKSNTELTYEGSGDNEVNDDNNVKSQIEYTLKYADGTTVSQNDTLKSKETKTMRLRLTYKTFNDATLLPKADVAISGLGISLTYTQDGNAKVNNDDTTPYVKVYSIGDQITVANETYHIISVPSNEDYLVALKDTPLTTSELNTYGAGHLNMYNTSSSSSHYQQAYDKNGIGGMAYYTSETCGLVNGSWIYSGCTTSYASSEVKYAVDAWATAKFQNSELKTVDVYSARLIKFDDLQVEKKQFCTGSCWEADAVKYDWMYNNAYWYWTMTPWQDGDQPSSSNVWRVYYDGFLNYTRVKDFSFGGAVRPVINAYKSKISS